LLNDVAALSHCRNTDNKTAIKLLLKNSAPVHTIQIGTGGSFDVRTSEVVDLTSGPTMPDKMAEL
jgi:hypothetical protein